jgi:xanthine/uracil permease
MRASATMFPVLVAVSMVLVVGGSLLQVGARQREMRDESNSKKEEKRACGGGHHRELGER